MPQAVDGAWLSLVLSGWAVCRSCRAVDGLIALPRGGEYQRLVRDVVWSAALSVSVNYNSRSRPGKTDLINTQHNNSPQPRNPLVSWVAIQISPQPSNCLRIVNLSKLPISQIVVFDWELRATAREQSMHQAWDAEGCLQAFLNEEVGCGFVDHGVN